jgi:hypothetical protein
LRAYRFDVAVGAEQSMRPRNWIVESEIGEILALDVKIVPGIGHWS